MGLGIWNPKVWHLFQAQFFIYFHSDLHCWLGALVYSSEVKAEFPTKQNPVVLLYCSWRKRENGWLTRAGGVQVVEGFPSCLPGWGGGLFLLLVEEEVEEVGAWWLTEVLVEDEPEVAAVVVVTLSVVDAWKGSVSSCSLLVVIACRDC